MFDLAGTLFGNRRDQVAQGSTLTATGSTASADGVAGIVIDADVTPAEGTGDEDVDQTVIDLPTSPDVAEGDEVIVTLVGDGPLKTPIVTANPGSGDRMAAAVQDAHDLAASVESIAQEAKEVANATGQHFWPDTDGVHVTEVTQDEWSDSTGTSYHSGANVLLNALGQLFRDGLNNILAIVSGTDPGVAIYDGEGNSADNIMALFSKALIRIGGRFASSGRSTAKVQFFEDDSALTDLTAEHYINTTTEPQVSHDLALSSTITDDELPDGTARTVTGNVEVWEQIYNDGSTYSDEVTASLNGATTNRQYNVSMGVQAIEASGGQVERTAFAVADTLRLTHGTGQQASTSDVPMEQAIAALTTPLYSDQSNVTINRANTDIIGPSVTVPAGAYIIVVAYTFPTASGSGTRVTTIGYKPGSGSAQYNTFVQGSRAAVRLSMFNIVHITAQTSFTAYVRSDQAISSASGLYIGMTRIS